MQLASLYGQGGGRIPLADGSSITLSRADLTKCIGAMSLADCRTMHQAACTGDAETAQRLLREAAQRYQASAAAPAAAPAPLPITRARIRLR
ncbi:MAG: hypothetical protein HGA45_08240 [Chloroflexales bacterium]|nr:hypothetical protein [Chloroflexales bacterium]